MKLYVNKLCHLQKRSFSTVDYDKLRFYIRKTLTYGTLVKMKHHTTFCFAYYCSFASGFSCSVIVQKQAKEQTIQQKMKGVRVVILGNDQAYSYGINLDHD